VSLESNALRALSEPFPEGQGVGLCGDFSSGGREEALLKVLKLKPIQRPKSTATLITVNTK